MRLTILFGGASFEHEISIVSAITLKDKLVSFELDFVFCDQHHNFYLIKPSDMKATIFSNFLYKKMPKLSLIKGGFLQKKLFSSKIYDGVVLNIIHGADGEDGVVSSLLDFFNIKYIGSKVDASVFSYNKLYTKYLCKSIDVKTLDYEKIVLDESHKIKMNLPVIIKPTCLGSSIGVSIVKEIKDISYALDTGFEYDNTLLVEPFIDSVKEYNLAGYKVDGEIKFSIIEEPQKNEFLDFEKKYMDFSRRDKPGKAKISQELEDKLKYNFKKIYGDMFDGSLIRCDFFVIDNEVYLNEINPIPGSMANYLFDDFELSIKELAGTLKNKNNINVRYDYIHSISSAKGK